MKKYFMQGTAEEVKIGDIIQLDLTKELSNGETMHHHLECKFIPKLIPLLLEQGVIEEQEIKEKKKASDKEGCIEECINILQSENKKLWNKVNTLEALVKELSLYIAYNPSQKSTHSPKSKINARKAG